MNIQTLNQYKEEGWLVNQTHPTLPLIIWNYTPKTQYEGFWDDITLTCRGLVTDIKGNVVARGFPKFFNIEENRHVATDKFEVFCKEDGQYIGVFRYNGEMVVNSRGSFTSPYVVEARRILDEKYSRFVERFGTGYNSSKVYPFTFCFELIGVEQIVVSYPEPDLILTGIISNKSGNDFAERWEFVKFDELKKVKKFNGLDYTQIKQLNWKNSEGFVVRFSNGSRCKIKFEDYLKLHRQMTNLSTTGIWEALMEGKPVSSILNDVPDEFFEKVRQYETELKEKFRKIEQKSDEDYWSICDHINNCNFVRSTPFRTEFALFANRTENPSILFAMLDRKDYSKIIWKLIKPKFEKI